VPGSAHGARKIAATRVANAGATVAQLEAIFGWRGGKATRHVATDLCAALRSAGPYRAQTGPLMPFSGSRRLRRASANAARAAAADLVRLRGQYQGSATGDRCAELHARCSSDYLKAEAALRADFVQARSSALARSFARAPKHREPFVAMATGSPRPATRRVQNSGRAARQVLHASQPLPLCRRQARGCGPPCGRWKNGAR
jgi:hypothetical protein